MQEKMADEDVSGFDRGKAAEDLNEGRIAAREDVVIDEVNCYAKQHSSRGEDDVKRRREGVSRSVRSLD